MIGRSLGSMNDVKDVVEDVLLLAGGLSAHGLCNEKQELPQAGGARGTRPCRTLTELLSASSATSPHKPMCTAVSEPSGAVLAPVLPHTMFGWEKARDNEQRHTRVLPRYRAEGVTPLPCAKGEKKKQGKKMEQRRRSGKISGTMKSVRQLKIYHLPPR